jgi:NAD-dependent DNA ligase
MTDHYFKGKRVCVTGTLNKTRAAVHADLQRVGAIIVDTTTGTTDYLICGDKTGATKTRAAERYGVKMLNKADYYAIMRGQVDEVAAVKPKLTHAEYMASVPESYGDF